MRIPKILSFLLALVSSVFGAESIGPLELLPAASVGSSGIQLEDLVTNRTDQPLPRVQLAPAPPIGRPLFFSRAQIGALLAKAAPDLVCSNWIGADRIKVARATRVVNELLLKDLLTEALQRDFVKDRGDLEIRFNRPWSALVVPDEPLSVKITEIPNSGVSPSFICRFELIAGDQVVGTYQQPMGAKIWKEIYVAQSNLTRGQALREAEVGLEKRDIVNNRDYLTSLPLEDAYVEFRENVPAGTQVSARHLRLRSIIKRGRLVDAIAKDDALTISVKAEALEDGVPGQMVRVRNIRSKREFKGKVQDEQTVVVVF
jgi:flagella basal body P-ring formation protein FlgA